MSRKSEEPTVAVGNSSPIELDLFKKTPEYKKVYHIRHKLQKLVYEKKPGEIQKEDFIKISQVVKEIEDASMTFDLLRVSYRVFFFGFYVCFSTNVNSLHSIPKLERLLNLLVLTITVTTNTKLINGANN